MNKKIREAIAERSGNVCEFCRSARAVQIHHLKFRSQGGQDTENNLIHLCFDCHTKAHNDIETMRIFKEMRHEN